MLTRSDEKERLKRGKRERRKEKGERRKEKGERKKKAGEAVLISCLRTVLPFTSTVNLKVI